MPRLKRTALYALGVAVALALAAAPAAPASAAGDPSSLRSSGSTDARAAAQTCVFYTHGDYVHISTSDGPQAASGHGWWTNGDCPTPLADVTVRLQVLQGGNWTTVAVSSKIVAPGGGAGRRATARMPCRTIAWTQWRSQIDVDLVGLFDSNEVLTTGQRGLYCGI